MSDLRSRLQNVLGDAYRIERELGGGGMSRVFLANEASLRRQVVIKVLPPEFASEMSEARFNQEIELAAHLQHPHILPVLSAGAKGDLLFYILPFVSGESLRHRLTREGKLPVADAVRILYEIADALAFAHTEGVIHRDIKPENILLQGEHAVLTDFGVARALAAARTGLRLTDTGMVIGSPGYMSPEQAAGDRQVDARADVYALAVVGYEMLAGAPPFDGPTAQALLVAQLTATPRPLLDQRPETPPEVHSVIMRALAKDPTVRLRTAAEFRDAVAGAMARRPGEGLGGRRRWVAIGAVGLAAAAAGALLLVRGATPGRLEPNLVAVAPFDVLLPNLDLWREGLVDVLSRNLDGAGPLRTVSPTVVIRRWSGRADPTSASALGHRTGAGVVVFGTAVGAGRDSVRLNATVFDAASSRALGEVQVAGDVSRMDRLGDSLTVAVLRQLGRTRAIGAVRLSSLGSTSLPAIKEFLRGEQFFRQAAWDSALAYYERAVALDSSFALALRKISLTLGWQRLGTDLLSRAYALRAGALNHGLAPRDSLLLAGDSLSAVLYQYVQDTAFFQHTRRLFSTLEEAARRYPADPEVWYALGDARFHFGVGPSAFDIGPGVQWQQRSLEPFDRAMAVDSAFAPAYIHPVQLALDMGDSAAARRYATRYLALAPTDEEGLGIRLVLKFHDPEAPRSQEVDRLLEAASMPELTNARSTLLRWPDSAEMAVRVARLAASRPGTAVFDSAFNRGRLAGALALRGHLREAYALAGTQYPPLFGVLAIMGAVPPDVAAREFARVRSAAGRQDAALLWWTARGDTTSLRQVTRAADSLAAVTKPPFGRDYWRFVGGWARASLALVRRDTAEALRRFDALPDSLCPLCWPSWLPRAQLLTSRGRGREALAYLGARVLFPFPVLEPVFRLELARVSERLGERAAAAAAYRYVADVWRNADPELQPYVKESQDALRRLAAEP